MRCSRVQRRLVSYIDEMLAERQRAAVDAHLNQCPTCAADVAEIRRLHGAVDELPVPPLPAGFEAELMRKVRDASEPAASPWVRWYVPLTAAACTAGLALYLVGRMPRPEEQTLTRNSVPVVEELPKVASVKSVELRPAPAPKPPEATRAAPPQQSASFYEPPVEPAPPELHDALDLFVDFPIIRDLEKFEHYYTIWTDTDEQTGATRGG